jgi:glyoxylase-like metal-dependent hydrolase (beta-lactamase superfamily II)/8-oxo-dGTP pyrophosphatase MutT (NUDIX family)
VNPPQRTGLRDSAAVVLVRGEGEELETYWAKRGEAVGYMPGFQAFIGGKVDEEDAELAIAGVEDPDERMLTACAIREAFEEAGVLVALDGPARLDGAAAARTRLLAGDARFADLVRRHGWRFRGSHLMFAGRWQTPPFSSMRFDTVFYVARVGYGQEPSIEPGELESGEWVRPIEALDRWRHGHATFAAPILWTLIALAEGEEDLEARLALGPERAATPVRRIELSWGIVLHPMKTRPLPPATHTNAYLIGEREMMLVDPGGDDPADLEALFGLIDTLGAEGRTLKLVVATHHHPDHIAGIGAVRERYGVPVAAHPETAKHMKVDFSVEDGQWLPLIPGLGDWNIQALHTPGHTRGHLCLLHRRTGSLFTGDLIPGGRGTVIIDPPEGDMAAYLSSLERLLELNVRVLFPGHGSPQGGAERRIRGLIAHRLEREGKVLEALDATPRPPHELVERAYADTKRELWGHAERSLLAHLEKLEKEGRASRSNDRWSERP